MIKPKRYKSFKFPLKKIDFNQSSVIKSNVKIMFVTVICFSSQLIKNSYIRCSEFEMTMT